MLYCHVKGGTVNDYPKLDAAGRDKFWADRKAAHKVKQGVAHDVVTDADHTPAPAPAPSVSSVPGSITDTLADYEKFNSTWHW